MRKRSRCAGLGLRGGPGGGWRRASAAAEPDRAALSKRHPAPGGAMPSAAGSGTRNRSSSRKPARAPCGQREPAKAPEIVELERLQKRLEDARKIAVMNPTEANVLRYLQLEAKVVRQASYFGDVAQRLGWAHPELNLSLEGRPVNAKAIEVFERSRSERAAQSIAELARDHVVFFFFRGDCPYCHAYAPTLRAFEDQTGLKVVAVSLDGGGAAVPEAACRQRHLEDAPRHPGAGDLHRPALHRCHHARRLWRALRRRADGAHRGGHLPQSRAMVPEPTQRISLQ